MTVTDFPEGLYLLVDNDTLRIADSQEVPHVLFTTGSGDPTRWSAAIVKATCRALGVTECYTMDGDELSIEEAITLWHRCLGAEDGFLP